MSIQKYIATIFFVFPSCLYSQSLSDSDKPTTTGKVEIYQDVRVSELVEKNIQYNENQKGIPGYRIQIFFDSGNNARNKANIIKSEFMSKYPKIEAYLIFQEPNFKVRVGDFRIRIDAERFEKILQTNYQGSFVVIDEINLPKLDVDLF